MIFLRFWRQRNRSCTAKFIAFVPSALNVGKFSCLGVAKCTQISRQFMMNISSFGTKGLRTVSLTIERLQVYAVKLTCKLIFSRSHISIASKTVLKLPIKIVQSIICSLLLINYSSHSSWLIETNSFVSSIDLLLSRSPQAFKIIILSRLTPIPFGLQNAIFAVNNTISIWRYLQATFIGLLPGQILNVYLGSTLRSMEQVMNEL